MPKSKAEETPVRGRGRPARDEAEVRQTLVEAATWVLLNKGLSAATIEAVAAHAGLAKKTVYRFVANREELLATVVRSWTDTYLEVAEVEVKGAGEVMQRLADILLAISHRALSKEAVGMYRLLVSDTSPRDDLLRAYNANGVERGRTIVAAWLQRQKEAGLLLVENPAETSDLLLSMVIAEPLREASLGLIPSSPQWDARPRIQASLKLLAPLVRLAAPKRRSVTLRAQPSRSD
jgi:AcrR family transcriptional regulator